MSIKNNFLFKYMPPLSPSQVAELDALINSAIADATANANANANKRAEELLQTAESEGSVLTE